MLCLDKTHKEDLAGIASLRETIEFLERDNANLAALKLRLEGEIDKLEERNEALLEKLLSVAGLGTLAATTSTPAQMEMSSVPATNSIRDFTQQATFAEAQRWAREQRDAALEAVKEKQ